MTGETNGSLKRWAVILRTRNSEPRSFWLHRVFDGERAVQQDDHTGPRVDFLREDGTVVEAEPGLLFEVAETDSPESLRALRKKCTQMESLTEVMES